MNPGLCFSEDKVPWLMACMALSHVNSKHAIQTVKGKLMHPATSSRDQTRAQEWQTSENAKCLSYWGHLNGTCATVISKGRNCFLTISSVPMECVPVKSPLPIHRLWNSPRLAPIFQYKMVKNLFCSVRNLSLVTLICGALNSAIIFLPEL